MGGSNASAAPGRSARIYSAKAEIDDFMRRFLAHAKNDNAAARAAPTSIVLRDGQLTSADLSSALEKLDILFSRLDIETTNVVQIEIQNEALKSLHQDRMRRHVQTLEELEKARLANENRCRELEQRLRAVSAIGAGGRLGAAKLSRLVKRDKRLQRHPAKALRKAMSGRRSGVVATD